ncbi:MAG: capsular polysaccharide biosynthesis protein [Pseudomonadota bacterium]
MPAENETPAAPNKARRAFYFNAGFLRQKRVRRIADLAGLNLQLGKPDADDLIAVWGHSPYAARGEAVARATGAGLVRFEDAFLRSVRTGREGELPLGLLIDHKGVHFDASQPSDLETLLATHPLDDSALLNRARNAIEHLKEAHLSKYNAFHPSLACPDPGYVLVVDQTSGDASVTRSGADANTFREMLYLAQEENPGAEVLIKTHPETLRGHRRGYFGPEDSHGRVQVYSDEVSPWVLLDGAIGVYTVSSQLGFEAIFAGHKPRVFGRPFYAGWGLTEDRSPLEMARRGRVLTRAQLFLAAMILYPKWYDPFRDRLCELEDVIDILEAKAFAWRQDRRGWVASGMRLWKRAPLQRMFGSVGRMRFIDPVETAAAYAEKTGRKHMAWASKSSGESSVVRVEDGFLRSRGLGAELTPPLSLICDDLGIYYDPSRESRLERLIAARTDLRADQNLRVERLIRSITHLGLSKYNLGQAVPKLPEGDRILIPGQVEDDASILTAAGKINTNLALVQEARLLYPGARLLYKPHPDVEAGLREGEVPLEALDQLDCVVLESADPAALLGEVHEVFTMTSLIGFEALLRGVKVTTTGAPFYAGWGLTRDLGTVPERRKARPALHGLVHAALIDYPRYFDPVTRQACPVEVIVDRLAKNDMPPVGPGNRALSKLQGMFASFAWLWR